MIRPADLLRPADGDEVSELRWRYRESAAVLSYFDPATLRPRGVDAEPGGAAAHLVEDTVVANKPGLDSRWILRAHIRKEALARLASREAMAAALALTPDRLVDDPFQCALEACISGRVPPRTDDLDSVRAAVQAVEWLNGILDGLPDLASLRGRVDLFALMQPFQQIAGSHFQGRAAELAHLAAHVGVSTAVIARVVETWRSAGLVPRPPLMICGPGGLGKSTLLARFLLDHAAVDDPRRVAFAYVDFDRPGFIDAPMAILHEAARQLAIQYPDTRERSEQFRRDASNSGRSGEQDATSHLMDRFSALVTAATGGTTPFVLVLDTFEELQYAGARAEQPLYQMLEELQRRLPQIRLLLAGRAPVLSPTIEILRLDQLDPQAAAGFLQSRGVAADAARLLAQHVGGTPLALQLAAHLVERESAADVIRDLDHPFLFFDLKEEVLQLRLYQRIVAHIHDPDVRRLAHPGLVLRRITPDAIREVLAEPCGLTIEGAQDAQRLFEELRREVALVVQADDRSLRPRPELRRVMLPLIRDAEPQKVAQIHHRAVTFFAPQSGVIPRAEEIYHRLSLDQDGPTIDARWMPGVEPYLYSAIEEVGARAQEYLSRRLGIVRSGRGSDSE